MKFQIEVIKSKIHRVTVTQADLNYGSITGRGASAMPPT